MADTSCPHLVRHHVESSTCSSASQLSPERLSTQRPFLATHTRHTTPHHIATTGKNHQNRKAAAQQTFSPLFHSKSSPLSIYGAQSCAGADGAGPVMRPNYSPPRVRVTQLGYHSQANQIVEGRQERPLFPETATLRVCIYFKAEVKTLNMCLVPLYHAL